MLRITKTSPGVLDLSAVKDEFGLPVVLNGPSHRDVPDLEESNLVLQRVVEAQWVTLTRLPIDVAVTQADILNESEASASPSEAAIATGEPKVSGNPETLPQLQVTEVQPAEDNNLSNAADLGDDVSHTQPPEDSAVTDVSIKPEGSNKPAGKTDTRRAGRRS